MHRPREQVAICAALHTLGAAGGCTEEAALADKVAHADGSTARRTSAHAIACEGRLHSCAPDVRRMCV
eukprot:6881561-Prymnesium_polylepis.1